MAGLPRQHLASIVGANIASIRASRGWSQGELSAMLGVSTTQLSRWENGKVGPRFERLESIATALQCPVAALFLTATDSRELLRATQPDTHVRCLAEGSTPYGARQIAQPAVLDHTTRRELRSLVDRIGQLLA